ncbi:MAG: pyridoxamine 5'-phosphate oxidase [Acidobacteria bacterium]|nr:pyridoxamine 5'-phosphate oxidase [Acidobacteriota bacterium]
MSIAELRRDYRSHVLVESEAAPDPFIQFRQWFDEAVRAELLEPNAMTLATVSPSGDPAARTVLLKGLDDTGFVFFTNYESAKGRDLSTRPRACLLFFWAELERQVRITGQAARLRPDESLEYFRSRPRGSQLGAWVSPQSQIIASRATLDDALAQLEVTYADGDIPLPPFWGGYRVVPDAVEFWQGRTSRLHDRLLYTRQGDDWSRVRLAP